jgi:hypothetical protein
MLLGAYDDPTTLPDIHRTLDQLKAGASAPLAADDEGLDEGKTAQELRREIEELESVLLA